MVRYHEVRHTIATYKFNSVFTKTFAFLMLFSALLLVVFYSIISNFSARNLIKASEAANISLVQQTANTADIAIANLSSNMHATLFDLDVIPLIIAPDGQSYEKKVALSGQLGDSIDISPLVLDGAVYVLRTDQLYLPHSGVVSLEQYAKKKWFKAYMENPYEGLLNMEDSYPTDVRFIGNQLLLFQEFPRALELRAGIIMYQLDSGALIKTIEGLPNESGRRVSVYRPDGHPVLPGGSETLPEALELDLLTQDQGTFQFTPASLPEQTIFYCRSPQTGWIFLYSMNSSELRLTFAPALSVTLPFLVLVFVLSLAMAFYITWLIYRPINQLMHSMVQPQTDDPQFEGAKNELDFLGIAFQNVKTREDMMSSMVGNLAPSVLERLFTHCLRGTAGAIQTIATTLKSLPTAFREDDRYLAVAVHITNAFHEATTPAEAEFCALSATNIAHATLESVCEHFVIRMDDDMLAVVLRFPPETPTVIIKQAAISFTTQMGKRVEDMPYVVEIAKGRIYNHITDLHYSYRNALEKLRLNAEPEEEQPAQIPEADGTYYNRAYFLRRISHVAEHIDRNDYPQALILCQRIGDDLGQDGIDVEMAKEICGGLMETLSEKLLQFKAYANDAAAMARSSGEGELQACETTHQIQAFAKVTCGEIIALLQSYQGKLHHKHIIRAQEVIQARYADCDLSLQTVAEEVGIHPSYLSRMFKENLGVSFLDYLNEYRVQQAKELLKSTSLTVKEIGFNTGFQSMPTFFRVFKKYCGMPPGQFRA